ncbi:hypothetical protein HJC23_004127 [Cyclotella cryptica]|uniref:Glucosidase 2 subunit beta n=1 Tax=Cyclotella cryptica TaxID=29204 RepID=A0ABD3PGM7_9STRA|eukprot:CCRYP_014665-RA/>CCRYP_014665-RA protein AED:0.01 eAED:0.01 QI:0/-1/0/1/-1/1/1/0/812
MALPSRKPALCIIITVFIHFLTLSTSASQSIKCASNAWFSTSPESLQTIPADKINDGYCDCPLDGLDELETGACAGSVDGMWAGVSKARVKEGEHSFFACPQQPALRLPLSRVNDGICDCCNGADERGSQKCGDNCEQVLAAERAARKKLQEDYEVGSKVRMESISQYQKWMAEAQAKLQKLKDVELAKFEKEKDHMEQALKHEKIAFSKKWLHLVNEVIPTLEPLTSIIGGTPSSVINKQHLTVDDSASFIISLCWLSGEASVDHVANGRCVPFDRASVDVGILWEHSDSDGDENSFPPYHHVDQENEDSLLEYAEKIISRVSGNDTAEWSNSGKKNKRKQARREQNHDLDNDAFDDMEDMSDDYYHGIEETDRSSGDESAVGDSEQAQHDNEKVPTSLDDLGKSWLESLHLSHTRNLFKDQAAMLLKLAPPTDENEDIEDGDEAASREEEVDDDNEEKDDGNKGIDPVAINMAKSTISKRLSSINRGEASAKFAARHIITLMKNRSRDPRSVLDDVRNLAVMIMYHSQISTEDIAELIYTTSSVFRDDKDSDPSTCSMSSPWDGMCPPKTITLEDRTTFPSKSIVDAARQRCMERADAMTGVCTVQEELDVKDFPTAIPEGYYNYYSPKSRESSIEADSFFSSITSLFQMPTSLSSLIDGMQKLDQTLNSLRKEVATLEGDVGGHDSLKFGIDGELCLLRDTCHKLESGKYEYEVCIFGKATQRDVGQTSGGTNLGHWQKMEVEDGLRTMKWSGGTKCWNGPQRSAEVIVTCGGLITKLLTADEPETCRYVFTMESPMACDDKFKLINRL